MALNDVTFTKGQGGLGRPLAGEDYISGMLFYRAVLPSGFSTTNRVKQVFSISDAQNLGIAIDYRDETKATSTYQVTAIGGTGDTIGLYVQDTVNNVFVGSYTKAVGDTTTTLAATGIKNAINALSTVTGYVATSAVDTVTLTSKAGLGVFLNTGTPLTVVITGTITGTITQFSGGVASLLAPMWYHISEYFRTQPQGNLFVGVYDIPSSYTFSEAQLMQNFAVGKIRQMGVYVDGTTFSTTHMNSLQTIGLAMDAVHMPISSFIYASNIVGTALTALTDLSLLSDYKVTASIGQDGGSLGSTLFKTYGKSITAMGAELGVVSRSQVSESIGWVGKFNVGTGTELNVVAFADGTLYRTASTGLINQLNSYRYTFLTKRVGLDGTWFNDSHTAIAQNNDYAYIENNRTIDKAIRNLYTAYLPSLSSPIVFNPDGTISDNTTAALIATGSQGLDQMVRDSDLSGKLILINPSQPAAATSTIAITAELLGVGVARNINVKIGYVLSL